MKNYILKNINTGIKENLNYSELQTRLNKNRKDFFNTYRIETVKEKNKTDLIIFSFLVLYSATILIYTFFKY
tara:strand:- start:381 stop:596 length:216 start_codon:yes stop_codon:yes gene_type:complete